MSAVYNFSLDRSRALLLAGCFAVTAILLFFAGSISGILYSGGPATAAPASKFAPVAKPMQSRAASPHQAAPAPAPATSSPTVASGSAQIPAPAPATFAPSPGSVAPATAALAAPSSKETKAPPAAPAEASAKATPQQPDAAPHPVEVSYAIPLAVRVGSFALKENAEGLTQSLKDLGYRPVMSRWSDSRGRAWYVVKLGPYARWNAASRVAARVSIAENVRPVIGPMQ